MIDSASLVVAGVASACRSASLSVGEPGGDGAL